MLFTMKKDNGRVKMLVSDLAGSEDPFEYCGIAAVEGFYVINSLYQIKQVIKKSDTSSISNLPTKNGLIPSKIVNKNFDRNTSEFKEPIIYNNDAADTGSTLAVKSVFDNIITKKTISYTFLNIKGYKDQSVGLEHDIKNTLEMVSELKEMRGAFGRIQRKIQRKRRTSRKRAKSSKRRNSRVMLGTPDNGFSFGLNKKRQTSTRKLKNKLHRRSNNKQITKKEKDTKHSNKKILKC